MSKGKGYSVKDEWFSKVDSLNCKISTWCKKLNDNDIFCQICTQTISCAARGYPAVSQHVDTKKHKENAKIKLNPSQLILTSQASFQVNTKDTQIDSKACSTSTSSIVQSKATPATLQIYSVKDEGIKAEIIWALKNVQSNMSAASCDDLHEVFTAMFPGRVAESFKMARTKLGYLITEALGPYFRKHLLDDAQKAFYTIIYDETTNNEGKKELQVAIRYWSEAQERICIHHLETFFVSHAKADDLHLHIKKAINNANLCLNKLVMLGSDGPNVNKKVWRLINEDVKESRGHSLVDIGTCSIHTVHNAFLKGIKELGENVNDLIIDIYFFFDDLPGRWKDYESIQLQEKVPLHRFVKHINTRWLTIKDAAERVLEQWSALQNYFLQYFPKNNKSSTLTPKYLRISKALKQKSTKAELYFVVSSASIFTAFTGVFQKEEPLIHVLYDELHKLVFMLAGRVCKPETITSFKSEDLFTERNLLPISKVEVCGDTMECINHLSEKDKLEFLFNAQKHFIAACKHLLGKTPIRSNSHIKYFRCLQPQELKKARSVDYIGKVVQFLPVQGVSIASVKDEWKLLQLEHVNYNAGERIDVFWNKVFQLMNAFNSPKYPVVTKLVKVCLALSHGSADVERGFSRSKLVLTEDKANMSERMLNARLAVVDGMKRFEGRAAIVPITQELLGMARLAHKSYVLFLEEEKRKRTEEAMRKAADDERVQEERKLHKLLEMSSDKLSNMEQEVKTARRKKDEKQASARSLLNEANDRLKAAIDKKDFNAISVAQGLMDGATSLLNQELVEEKQVLLLEKQISKINKRKSGLITSFFSKRTKND